MEIVVIITVMTLATVAAAAMLAFPRARRRPEPEAPAAPVPVPDAEPVDPARAFGYQMSWLAIRTRDNLGVAERLGLTAITPVEWNDGVARVYSETDGETAIFVTPPVNGWTFAVGLALPQPLGKAFADKTVPLLLDLGSHFIEVQYYLAYPALDCFAWARVIDGKLVRAYAINDEGVIWNKGQQTREERTLGIRLYEMRGVKKSAKDAEGDPVLYPTEQHLMHLAGKWSIDPTTLDRAPPPVATGWLGDAPSKWRPERFRRSA